MNRKVWTNPQTGMLETVDDVESLSIDARLQRTRREVREMISGNVQFHQDDLGPAPADTETAA